MLQWLREALRALPSRYPGSIVHCIENEENPPNSNEDCLPGSEVHCIDDDGDHNNLRELFELDIDELLQLDADDLRGLDTTIRKIQ